MGMSMYVVAVDDAPLAGWSSGEAVSALLAGSEIRPRTVSVPRYS